MAVRNLDRLKKRLAALPASVRTELAGAIDKGADEIVALQRDLAPKRTGALARSIQKNKGGAGPAYSTFKSAARGDADLKVTITAGNTDVRYAHLVEFGTKPHMNKGKFEGTENPGATAKPFFYPAYRALKKRAAARIVRAGRKAAKGLAAK